MVPIWDETKKYLPKNENKPEKKNKQHRQKKAARVSSCTFNSCLPKFDQLAIVYVALLIMTIVGLKETHCYTQFYSSWFVMTQGIFLMGLSNKSRNKKSLRKRTAGSDKHHLFEKKTHLPKRLLLGSKCSHVTQPVGPTCRLQELIHTLCFRNPARAPVEVGRYIPLFTALIRVSWLFTPTFTVFFLGYLGVPGMSG